MTRPTFRPLARHVARLLLWAGLAVASATAAQACTSDGTPEGDIGFASCSCVISAKDYWFGALKTCVPSGFTGTHTQMTSNAGDCPSCTITVTADPRSDRFVVRANNGWSAGMVYRDQRHTVAEGTGTWPQNWGAYSGKPFNIRLTRSRCRDLPGSPRCTIAGIFTRMEIETPGVGTIQAGFRRSRTPSLTELGLGHYAQ